MAPEEIDMFYRWAIESGPAAFWYGEPYGDPMPSSKEAFLKDWEPHYLAGEPTDGGRCFVILVEDRPIGEINYNEIDRRNDSVELDILIADERDRGQGHGTDAMKTLIRWLFQDMGVSVCWLEVHAMNERAIRSYEKAGFTTAETYTKDRQAYRRLELRNSGVAGPGAT